MDSSFRRGVDGPTGAIRGRLLWFEADPAVVGERESLRYVEDGLVILRDGHIDQVGAAAELMETLPRDGRVADYRPNLVLPGFIDPHLHMPQTQVIASYGAELLDWLANYTFVEEQRYVDRSVAEAGSRFLLDELLRCGTTTAAVYCTVHPQSVDAFFSEAEQRNMRMVAGKVMMDRGAPEALTDTPERSYEESEALISRWHARGRLAYAITPRFAVTSTEAQLEAAGALAAAHPDMHVQTHLSENDAEIAFVRKAFPWAKDYTQVYERYGLVRRKALFGHCIHLEGRERDALSDGGASAVFCPTSNLFLGSGLYDFAGMRKAGVVTALATDIGGGTSYSMLVTASEAYKALALRGQKLPALQAFHMMTRGNAEAMGLGDKIGRLKPGMEADLTVLDSRATSAMRQRMARAETLAEELFVLMMMGDDRAIAATYVMGKPAYEARRR